MKHETGFMLFQGLQRETVAALREAELMPPPPKVKRAKDTRSEEERVLDQLRWEKRHADRPTHSKTWRLKLKSAKKREKFKAWQLKAKHRAEAAEARKPRKGGYQVIGTNKNGLPILK